MRSSRSSESRGLRALVVDDEPLARRELERLLSSYPDVAVVQHADSGGAALAAMTEQPPDVVFLDIRLGGESGFEIVPSVPHTTAIVFVTAYDEYAVRAFEVHALDYLLKPVDPDRLRVTIQRLAAAGADRDRHALPSGMLTVRDWLFLRTGRGDEFVRVAGVACVTAEGDYTRVITSDGRQCLLHRTLTDWERQLPADSFVRVHRSALVNLQHVVAVDRAANLTGRVRVRGCPTPIEMSRRAVLRLRRQLA
jgi:two-component system, LytTR family, response regulator